MGRGAEDLNSENSFGHLMGTFCAIGTLVSVEHSQHYVF